MSEKTKKSGNFFNSVLNIFSEEVPTKNKTKDEPKRTSKAVPTAKINFDSSIPLEFQSTTIGSTPTATQAKFNEEFYNHFQKVIEDNDLDGSDYFEFMKSYKALKESANMSEIGALQATFSMLKANAPELTIEKLLNTATHYLDVIEAENKEFQNQLVTTTENEIVHREKAIEAQVKIQSQKRESLVNLQEELDASIVTVSELKNEILAENQKISEVKGNWDFTINLVKRNIETDKSNIQSHLGTN